MLLCAAEPQLFWLESLWSSILVCEARYTAYFSREPRILAPSLWRSQSTSMGKACQQSDLASGKVFSDRIPHGLHSASTGQFERSTPARPCVAPVYSCTSTKLGKG